ncbi:ABC-type iron transport system FetAB, ATPase component [Devosia sp. YR412]|uniref:ABC transporter ATP-binding protein n=1 Tax=Devosia sp. YR412 TaxID=1881030 RepID=UPI0008ACEA61|nr:ATP-binding cassette domain-containing protein [Devosia sp. YR412]SEP64456.1 ABC-type iron transport system FetAB, ATPase component [Devosia sp. YR412]
MAMGNHLVATGLAGHAVGPIDFTVEGGQCLAVTGKSGSGKSLLLRMVADLMPHQGSCSLDGALASAMPAPQWRQLVRYVAAEPGWWTHMVEDHFSDPAFFAAQAKQLGLASSLGRAAPERLSTGERQRAAILRAIEHQPKVLLLDEPSSALDEASTLKLEALIRALMQEGLAVILVSHNPDQVARLATKRLTIGETP